MMKALMEFDGKIIVVACLIIIRKYNSILSREFLHVTCVFVNDGILIKLIIVYEKCDVACYAKSPEKYVNYIRGMKFCISGFSFKCRYIFGEEINLYR